MRITIYAQNIQSLDTVNYKTNRGFFSVWNEGQILYEINGPKIYLRVNQGTISLKPDSYQTYKRIDEIYLSLSKIIYFENRHTWNHAFISNSIDVSQVLSPEKPLDISCLPEIQCYEFYINIPENTDLSEYWITMTTKSELMFWYSHHNFGGSSFVEFDK